MVCLTQLFQCSIITGIFLILGEDIELCSELLTESLEALRILPICTLYEHDNVSPVWIEVVEKSSKFLRQVVEGYVFLK